MFVGDVGVTQLVYSGLMFRSIAASAPVYWFPNTTVPEDIYDRIVTRSFVNAGCIADNVVQAWNALDNLADSGNLFAVIMVLLIVK